MHVRRTYVYTTKRYTSVHIPTGQALRLQPTGKYKQGVRPAPGSQAQEARNFNTPLQEMWPFTCKCYYYFSVCAMHKIHTHNYYQHLACTQHLLHIHSHACQGQDYWGMPRESLVHHEYNRPTPRRAVQVRQVDRFWD